MSEVERLQKEADRLVRYAEILYKAHAALLEREGQTHRTLILKIEALEADLAASRAISALLVALPTGAQ